MQIQIEHWELACGKDCDLLVCISLAGDSAEQRFCAMGWECVGTDGETWPSRQCPGPGRYDMRPVE